MSRSSCADTASSWARSRRGSSSSTACARRCASCAARGGRARLVGFLVAQDAARRLALDALRAALARARRSRSSRRSSRGSTRSRAARAASSTAQRAARARRARTRAADAAPPRDALEARCVAAFAEVLRLARPPSVEADVFLDLGADSLAAAELVARLREDAATARVAVRDLYETRSTARALAERLRAAGARRGGTAHGAAARRGPRARPRRFTLGQLLAWLALELLSAAALARLVVFALLPRLAEALGLAASLTLAPLAAALLALAWTPLAVGVTVAAKRALLGAYRPGRYAAWSGVHLRHWIVCRCARRIPWRLLAGTGATGLVLRALGARVGRDVYVHAGVDLAGGGWDLLELGDEAVLARDAALRGRSSWTTARSSSSARSGGRARGGGRHARGPGS
ncbi:MAG: hypothetical protein H6828_08240 [Planctomycetes bacterium]|nr:hypothetical protein [Planctomycetota bacterium]